MIVMHHHIRYELEGSDFETDSSLIVKGENEVLTAMAKTVGLPMGIAARLLLNDRISARGVQMPLSSEFYVPVLEELEQFGVVFTERQYPSTTKNPA
jgi:hypothetical protein